MIRYSGHAVLCDKAQERGCAVFPKDLGLHLPVFLGALPGGLYDEVGGEDAYVNEQGDTALENV